jgi:hypothetical protein
LYLQSSGVVLDDIGGPSQGVSKTGDNDNDPLLEGLSELGDEYNRV